MSHTEKPDEAPTPRTECGDWPTPKYAQEIVFEGRGCVVMSPEEYAALYESHAQLERELAAAQSSLRASQAEAGQRDAVDAERYRWLRDAKRKFAEYAAVGDCSEKELDAAIDAAMNARGRSGGSEQG